MKTFVFTLALTGMLSGIGLQAQEAITQPAQISRVASASSPVDESPKGRVPAVKALPSLDVKVTKIFSGGSLYASVIGVNTGQEFVGLTVPARYGTSASEDGRDIVVYLDGQRRDWVKFKFLTDSYTNFTHEAVWPTISQIFGGASPVFATSYVMNRPVLTFTSKVGNENSLKQQRVQLIPLKGGTLSVSATVYGQEGDVILFKIKQLVASLQFTSSEKELKHAEPIFED